MRPIKIVLYLLAGACCFTAASLALGVDLDASMSAELLPVMLFPLLLSIGLVFAHYYCVRQIAVKGRSALYVMLLLVVSLVLVYVHYVTFKYMGFDDFRVFFAVFALPMLVVIELGGLSAIEKYF